MHRYFLIGPVATELFTCFFVCQVIVTRGREYHLHDPRPPPEPRDDNAIFDFEIEPLSDE